MKCRWGVGQWASRDQRENGESGDRATGDSCHDADCSRASVLCGTGTSEIEWWSGQRVESAWGYKFTRPLTPRNRVALTYLDNFSIQQRGYPRVSPSSSHLTNVIIKPTNVCKRRGQKAGGSLPIYHGLAICGG